MTILRFDSLEISDFRIFRRLEIAQLGRVNLVTGQNSVGKTCLLEALRLYASGGSPSILRQLLAERDQLYRIRSSGETASDPESVAELADAIRYLFHDGDDAFHHQAPIQVGPLNNPQQTLSITPSLLIAELGADRVLRSWRRIAAWRQPELDTGLPLTSSLEEMTPGLSIQLGGNGEQLYSLQTIFNRPFAVRSEASLFTARYVPAQSLESNELSVLWDQVTLTELEGTVLDAMNVIAPRRIEGINIVGTRGETVIVKLADEEKPVTLRSLGAGLVRAFGLALALVRSKGGLLLIDEVDSGLHYSVQYSLWKLMLAVAEQLNIQVFATTHSWDAVASFQQATRENKGVDGMLIRLDQKAHDIVATCFDERRLAIATREQIEVR